MVPSACDTLACRVMLCGKVTRRAKKALGALESVSSVTGSHGQTDGGFSSPRKASELRAASCPPAQRTLTLQTRFAYLFLEAWKTVVGCCCCSGSDGMLLACSILNVSCKQLPPPATSHTNYCRASDKHFISHYAWLPLPCVDEFPSFSPSDLNFG